MFCKNCGHEIAPDTSFCASCGTPVSPQQQQPQPPQPPQQPPIQAQQPTQPTSQPSPVQQPQQPPQQQPPIQAQQPTQPTQPTPQPSPVQQSPQPSPVTPYSVPNSAYTPGGYAEGPLGTPKKKRGWLIAIIVIAAVVVISLVFALIIYPQFIKKDSGSGNGSEGSSGITNEETNDADDDADTEDDAAIVAIDPALENYLAILQPQLKEIVEQTKASGMTLDVSARGSAMVYTYTYLTDIGDVATAKSALEMSESLLGEASKLLIMELETAGVSSPSVIYEYVNSDGTMIYSKEFK